MFADPRFDLLRPLGEGGMGQVLLVRDRADDREVALKVLSAALVTDDEARRRFRDEYRLLLRLAHPRTVAAYDFGTLADGRPYFTMEQVPGPGLDERLPLAGEEALPRLIEALEGLAFVHGRGIAHADLTPGNLRLGADGALKLMDFGLAARLGETAHTARGTMLYAAPEVIRGGRIDARSDLYTLAAVFYHLLAGRPPFQAGDLTALMRAHCFEPPVPLSQLCPEAPPELSGWIMRNLAKAPLERSASSAEALAELGREVASGPTMPLVPGFVGRASALDAARAALAAASAEAKPRRLAFTGGAGLGKTRLLEALQGWALVEGHGALGSRPLPGENTPYAALAAARRALAARLPDWTLPEPGAARDPREARRLLTAAWAEGLAALATPVIWLLDDWDEADEASRELIAALAQRSGLPLVLVETGRVLPDAQPLTGLSVAEVGDLAAQVLGAPEVAPPFAAELHRFTEGTPALALAALANLLGRGGIPREGRNWRTDRAVLQPEDVPAGGDGVASGRLAGLDGPATKLAETLAVLRRPIPWARLSSGLGLTEDALAEAADALRDRGLLEEAAGAVYLDPVAGRSLTSAMAPEAAARTARALAEALSPESDEAEASTLARLWRAAGEPERARPFALAAARYQIRHFSLAEAARALGDMPDDVALPPAVRAEASALAGDLARYQAAYEVALTRYQAAEPDLPGPRARLAVNVTLALQGLSRFEAAIAAAERAAAIAADEGDAYEEARVLTTLARLHHQSGEAAAAQSACERGLEAARRAGARGFEAEALGLMGVLRADDPPAALALLEQALALREAEGDPVGLNDAYCLLGNVQMAAGRFVEARASFERNLAICRELGSAGDDAPTALANLAMVMAETGALAEGLEAAAEAIAGFQAGGNRFLEGYALGIRGRLRQLAGQLAGALEDAEAARAIAAELESKYLDALLAAYRAPLWLDLGDAFGALEEARAGLALCEASGNGESRVALEAAAAEAFAAMGQPGRARRHVEAARRLAETQGPHARALAAYAAATAAGALEEAVGSLAEAQTAAREASLAPLSARLALLSGALSARTGDTPAAQRAWAAAQAEAEAIGAVVVAAAATLARSQAHPQAVGPHMAEAAQQTLATLAAQLPDMHREGFSSRWLPAAPVATDATRPSRAGMGEIVADFGRMVTGTLRYEEVLDRVIDQVMAITAAERGMIMLVEPSGTLSGLVMRPRPEQEDQAWMSYSRSFVEAALTDRSSVWIADAQADARFGQAQSVLSLDLRTVICVPLLVEGRPIGVLYVDQRNVNRQFTAEDLALVEGLAGFAALAIANARAYEETRERTELLGAVQALARLLGPQVGTGEILETIAAQAQRVARAERVVVLVGEAAEPAFGTGSLEVDPELVRRATRTGQAMAAVTDAARPESVMLLPLEVDWQPLGLLYVAADRDGKPFPPRDLGVMEAIAAQAALALDHLARRESWAARIAELESALGQSEG